MKAKWSHTSTPETGQLPAGAAKPRALIGGDGQPGSPFRFLEGRGVYEALLQRSSETLRKQWDGTNERVFWIGARGAQAFVVWGTRGEVLGRIEELARAAPPGERERLARILAEVSGAPVPGIVHCVIEMEERVELAVLSPDEINGGMNRLPDVGLLLEIIDLCKSRLGALSVIHAALEELPDHAELLEVFRLLLEEWHVPGAVMAAIPSALAALERDLGTGRGVAPRFGVIALEQALRELDEERDGINARGGSA